MNRTKFLLIANQYLKINNPVSEDKIDKVISLLKLGKEASVVDIGGGKGEILFRVMKKHNTSGTLIEINSELLNTAKTSYEKSNLDNKILMINKDAKEYFQEIAKNSIDCAICIGSSHAFGGYDKSLITLKQFLKKGGYLVIGQGYWKKDPQQEYLDITGMKKEEQMSHIDNIKLAEDSGFIYLFSIRASDEDWDNFEGLFSMGVENYVFENPDDSDNQQMLDTIRVWRNAYLEYGKDNLGFALYLFRNK